MAGGLRTDAEVDILATTRSWIIIIINNIINNINNIINNNIINKRG